MGQRLTDEMEAFDVVTPIVEGDASKIGFPGHVRDVLDCAP
jgi:hypothetical protein